MYHLCRFIHLKQLIIRCEKGKQNHVRLLANVAELDVFPALDTLNLSHERGNMDALPLLLVLPNITSLTCGRGVSIGKTEEDTCNTLRNMKRLTSLNLLGQEWNINRIRNLLLGVDDESKDINADSMDSSSIVIACYRF